MTTDVKIEDCDSVATAVAGKTLYFFFDLTKYFHIFKFLFFLILFFYLFFFVAAEPHIGKGFLIHAETMKKVYTEYCINHDKAEQLLEKYEQIPEVFT